MAADPAPTAPSATATAASNPTAAPATETVSRARPTRCPTVAAPSPLWGSAAPCRERQGLGNAVIPLTSPPWHGRRNGCAREALNMKTLVLALGMAVGLVATGEAQTLYRYTDAQGQVHITDGANGGVPKGASVESPPPPRKRPLREQFDEVCRGLDQLNVPRSMQMQLICDDLARESARAVLKALRANEARSRAPMR